MEITVRARAPVPWALLNLGPHDWEASSGSGEPSHQRLYVELLMSSEMTLSSDLSMLAMIHEPPIPQMT